MLAPNCYPYLDEFPRLVVANTTDLDGYDGVPAEAGPDRMVSTELRVWDAIEMLTGPKVNMDDRVLATVPVIPSSLPKDSAAMDSGRNPRATETRHRSSS